MNLTAAAISKIALPSARLTLCTRLHKVKSDIAVTCKRVGKVGAEREAAGGFVMGAGKISVSPVEKRRPAEIGEVAM
jgi:hypothetical protein